MPAWVAQCPSLLAAQGLHAVNRFTHLAAAGAEAQVFAPGAMSAHRIVLMDGAEKVIRLPGGDSVTANDLRNAVAGLVRGLPLPQLGPCLLARPHPPARAFFYPRFWQCPRRIFSSLPFGSSRRACRCSSSPT